MRKLLTLAISLLTLFALTGRAYAGSVSIRLEEPKSPTNQNNFDINFVSMDLENRTVTVKCFKKALSDSDFVQFGSDITLSPTGGNSGNCHIDSNVITGNGTYQFRAQAFAGSESPTSETVSVTYNSDGPGTPTNWSKDKIGSCTYKIHFRSADDAGRTIKVNVYRSSETSFNLDSGTQVGTVNIGSNTDADFSNDIPDCNKTYYYAVRAFDSAGNGSGVLGDVVNVTNYTTVYVSPTPGQGAIPVSGGAGTVLGQSTGSSGATGSTGVSGKTNGENGNTLGTVTVVENKPAPKGNIFSGLFNFVTNNPLLIGGMVAVIIGILLFVIIF